MLFAQMSGCDGLLLLAIIIGVAMKLTKKDEPQIYPTYPDYPQPARGSALGWAGKKAVGFGARQLLKALKGRLG